MMTLTEIKKLYPVVRMGECDATAHEVNYNGERLEYLDQYIQSMINEGKVKYAGYCICKSGHIFVDAALGNVKGSGKDASEFRTNTAFDIKSISKLIYTIALLKLSEDGLAYPDGSLQEWIKDFSDEDLKKITGMEANDYIKDAILKPCSIRDSKQATCREIVHLGEMLLKDGYYRGKRVIGKNALAYLEKDFLDKMILEDKSSCVLLTDRNNDLVISYKISFSSEKDWDFKVLQGIESIIYSGLN